MALKEIRLEHEEGAPCTAIREGKKTHSTLYNHCLGNARPSATALGLGIMLDLEDALHTDNSPNKSGVGMRHLKIIPSET